eukprot:JP440587.1.p1 GENE.JP440587.1~~JP440587.1.p1  ORF type:complete len:60 (-),score=11.42 JP440587.1:15-194(-)
MFQLDRKKGAKIAATSKVISKKTITNARYDNLLSLTGLPTIKIISTKTINNAAGCDALM